MKVMALPRDPNPYQQNLYRELAGKGARVRYIGELTPSRTLNLLLLPFELGIARARGWRILHLHWVFAFALPWARRVPPARWLAQAWFRVVLAWARLLGIRLVWTAHNTLPHQRVFHDDVAARHTLVAASDLVLAHSETTLDALREIGAPEPRRKAIVPHGPLHPSPDPAALKRPGSGPLPRRLLYFGRVLEYKGVEELLEVMARNQLPVVLTVAGECPDPELRERVRDLAERAGDRVELRLEYLDDAELSALLAQSDAVVLPFRRVTTSGSALLAMSYGRPVVLPDLPAFRDLPDDAVIRYDGSVEGLEAALIKVARGTPARLQRTGDAAAAAVRSATWSDAAAATAAAFESLNGHGGMRSRVAAVVSDHQYRGSLELLANTVMLAAFGFVFWAVAARSYDASAVGGFSGVTASATLLGTLAALGLPNTLIRHLHRSEHARALVLTVIGAVVSLGGVVCLAVVALLGPAVPASLHLGATGREAMLLVALVVLTSASGAGDAGLISLRATRAVIWKNLAGSVVKVAALPALTTLGVDGIVLAYSLGTGLSTILGVAALWRRLPVGPRLRGGVRELRRYASFSVGNYAGTLFGILPLTGIPLLVILERGSREAGWFAPALLVVGFLNFIPSTAAQVLFAEASREAGGLAVQVRKALRGTYGLLLPSLAVLVVAAPFVLALFGPQYVGAATGPLRLLALGTLFTGGTYLVDAILTARDRIRAYIFMNAANAALVLGAVGVLLPHGLSAAAFAWAVAQAVSLALGLVVLAACGLWRELRLDVNPREQVRAGTTSTGLRRLGYLDGLRGVAATFVVVSHGWDTIFSSKAAKHSTAGTLTGFLGFGRYAVALFIVISGFSLGLAAWRKGLTWPGGARSFLRRRVRRIYPPYLLAVLVSSLVGATVLAHRSGTLYDGAIPIRLSGVLVHGGLLQDVMWKGPAGSTAFWSIAVEFHIYFFFLLLLVAMRRRAWAWLPAVAALMVLTVATYMNPGVAVLHKLSWLYPSLYALFVLGVASARFAVPGREPDRRRWELFLVAMFTAAVITEVICRSRFDPLGQLNDLWLGPLFALFVSRVAAGDLRRAAGLLGSRAMVWLGSSSYSLYLIHAFVLEMVWRWAVRPLGRPPLQALALEVVLGLTASVAVARVFYRLVERPFLRPSAPPVESPAVRGAASWPKGRSATPELASQS